MIAFFVPGTPAPQGSKRPFRTKTGRTVLVESSAAVKPWRLDVAACALEARQRSGLSAPLEGPVSVKLSFAFQRPKGHYAASGKLRKGAPDLPAVKPDIDKLVRAVLDAVTGVLMRDDSQVTSIQAGKAYASEPITCAIPCFYSVNGIGGPGVYVEVWPEVVSYVAAPRTPRSPPPGCH